MGVTQVDISQRTVPLTGSSAPAVLVDAPATAATAVTVSQPRSVAHRALDAFEGSRGNVVLQMSISALGLSSTAALLSYGHLGIATVAGLIAGAAATGIAASSVGRFFSKPSTSNTGVSELTTQQRETLIAAIAKLRQDGMGFVTQTETNHRYGGTALTPSAVLGALAAKGSLYFGNLTSGTRDTVVWSQQAFKITHVQQICNFANIGLDSANDLPR